MRLSAYDFQRRPPCEEYQFAPNVASLAQSAVGAAFRIPKQIVQRSKARKTLIPTVRMEREAYPCVNSHMSGQLVVLLLQLFEAKPQFSYLSSCFTFLFLTGCNEFIPFSLLSGLFNAEFGGLNNVFLFDFFVLQPIKQECVDYRYYAQTLDWPVRSHPPPLFTPPLPRGRG